MQSSFGIYFELGLKHIADLGAYDHLLFIIAITVGYSLNNCKKLSILITAFTLGHSITLVLAVLKIIKINASVIEFLIPLTIIITCILNIYKKNTATNSQNYLLALGFGFIHGMGFSNYLNSLLGLENNIVEPLFAFNIGLEVGQLFIVFIFLFFGNLCQKVFNISEVYWFKYVSFAALILSFCLLWHNKTLQNWVY